MEGLARYLFGNSVEFRWIDVTFTYMEEPAFEMEIKYNDEWLEVLAAGVTKKSLIDGAGHIGKVWWSCALV